MGVLGKDPSNTGISTGHTKAHSSSSAFGGVVFRQQALAFQSNAPRFHDKQLVDESEAYLGPGYYEAKSCFSKNKPKRQVQTAIGGRTRAPVENHASRSFAGSKVIGDPLGEPNAECGANTGAPFDIGAAREAMQRITHGPGPGHYSQKNLHSWIKRSYNVNFTNM